jgi:TonB family protein
MRLVLTLALALVQLLRCPAFAQAQSPVHAKPIPTVSDAKRPIRIVKPVYPDEARKAGIEGSVVLDIVVDEHGSVSSVESAKGPKELVPAAVAAVKQWRWEPFLLNGKPQAIRTKATVQFVLHKDESVNGSLVACSCEIENTVCLTQGEMAEHVAHIEMKPDLMGNHSNYSGEAAFVVGFDERGRVTGASAISGHPLAISHLMAGVSKWRFKPVVLRHQRKQACGRLVIQFAMKENVPSASPVR